jgi:hypothetical protein
VIKVVDEFYHPYPFEVTKVKNYLRIRIGDPEKFISGNIPTIFFIKFLMGWVS